jgi:hypothetical protein
MKLFVTFLMGCVICSNLMPVEADLEEFIEGILAGFAGKETEKYIKKNTDIKLSLEMNLFLTITSIILWIILCALNPGAAIGVVVGGGVSNTFNPSDD